MNLYSIMGGIADPEAYEAAFGTVNQQALTKTEAYNSPPSLSEVYREYGSGVYAGLHKLHSRFATTPKEGGARS